MAHDVGAMVLKRIRKVFVNISPTPPNTTAPIIPARRNKFWGPVRESDLGRVSQIGWSLTGKLGGVSRFQVLPMISGPALSRCRPAPTANADVRSGTTARSWRASLTGIGVELPGGTCRSSSARGRRCESATAAQQTGSGIGSMPFRCPKPTSPGASTGRCRWSRRSTAPTSTERTYPTTQGAR